MRYEESTRYDSGVECLLQSWLGKPQFALEGVVHTYMENENGHEAWTRVKHVPKDRVVAQIEGSWKHRIRWRRTGETVR